MNILALGDCNTLGDAHYSNDSFPERFAKHINASVRNCGYTMSTTREMLHFAKENIENADMVLIQYGLVDSWRTFKYAPYILYYPDSVKRKIARKIIKKYKKIARNLGLNEIFGSENVVPIEEYKRNLESIISQHQNKTIILIDTVPNKDLSRNDEILRYNSILDELNGKYTNLHHLKLYDLFIAQLNHYYSDNTHINNSGYELITNELVKLYSRIR